MQFETQSFFGGQVERMVAAVEQPWESAAEKLGRVAAPLIFFSQRLDGCRGFLLRHVLVL